MLEPENDAEAPERGESGLDLLVQRYVLHDEDIFADHLADDRIGEQQHISRFR